MDDFRSFFKDKRVTLMGLGLLGRGIGDAAFLAQCGAILTVTDLKTREQLMESLERLSDYPDIAYVLGEHRLEDFKNADMVIKAAGVPLDSPYIQAARTAGVPVYMTTALFAKFAADAGATIVSVTGTRGKSTVTQWIHYGLLESKRRAHLGGNVRGLSTLALLPDIQKGDLVVLELDSWQLQGFGDLKISPDVAIFTNLMLDHLNYYPDAEAYFSDKANIFKYQSRRSEVGTPTGASGKDALIVGRDVAERVLGVNPPVVPVVPKPIPEDWTIRLAGAHNRDNAALAAEALKVLGLSTEEVRHAIETFAGVEGRLQKVATIGGVEIYNDNNATTPEATLAALRTFPSHTVILIAGGADKGLPLTDLALEAERAQSLVLLSGTGTQRLKPLLSCHYVEADSAEKALELALQAAKAGSVVLFSPAFASFGLFKNEYDRNDRFMSAVRARQG